MKHLLMLSPILIRLSKPVFKEVDKGNYVLPSIMCTPSDVFFKIFLQSQIENLLKMLIKKSISGHHFPRHPI